MYQICRPVILKEMLQYLLGSNYWFSLYYISGMKMYPVPSSIQLVVYIDNFVNLNMIRLGNKDLVDIYTIFGGWVNHNIRYNCSLSKQGVTIFTISDK